LNKWQRIDRHTFYDIITKHNLRRGRHDSGLKAVHLFCYNDPYTKETLAKRVDDPLAGTSTYTVNKSLLKS